MEKKRPNILFIMTDQFRADVMSCAGGCARTPALDSLAAEGIRFTECYTVSPLCVPARVSMMTGLYPHTTGVWKNANYVLSPDANLWVKAIHDSGYATSVFGKLHLHTDYGDFIKREITLLTNRHRYLSKPAKHFISLTQAFFAAIELERAGFEDGKPRVFNPGFYEKATN